MIKGPPLPSGDGKIDYDDEFLLLMARRIIPSIRDRPPPPPSGDGKIDYDEFLLLMARRIMDSDEGIGAGSADGEESLRHAFKVFDR